MNREGRQPDQQLLQAAVDQAFNSVLITDARLTDGGPLIEFCNPAFCRMTGYQPDELIGRSPKILQGPATERAVLDELRGCLQQERFFQGSTVNYRKDGTPYVVEWNISPIRDPAGRVTHFVSVQQNITARVEAERMRDLLAEALNASSDPVLITDKQARICFANQSFEQVSGYSSAEVMGRTPKFLQSGAHGRDFYAALVRCLGSGLPFRATFRNRRKDGAQYYSDQSITPLADGNGRITHFLSISKDITEAVEHTLGLSEQAYIDKLTGLLNRQAGDQAVQGLIDSGGKRGFSILLGDIDYFKRINDSFGHLAGDRVLRSIGQILREVIRTGDHAVRWGGEEFLITLPGAPVCGATSLGQRIREQLAAWSDPEVGQVTMSWGAAQWRPGETGDALLERADQLLYAAKAGGRDRVESEVADS